MSAEDDRVQLYRLRGRWVLRAPPSGPTTPAQVAAREALAASASKTKGRKRTGRLPPAAEVVAMELRGRTFGRIEPNPRWRMLLVEFLVRHGYSRDAAESIVTALQEEVP